MKMWNPALIPPRSRWAAIVWICVVASTLAPVEAPAQSVPDLAIQPGDMIRLVFSVERDLDGEFLVDENGTTVLPLLGTVDTSHRSSDELREVILERYAGQLRNQSVQVQLLRRISVTGSVRTPGLLHVDPTVGIRDALALAGGIDPDGVDSRVEIRIRGSDEVTELSREHYASYILASGNELWVPQKSWLSRNSPAVFGGLLSATAIILSGRWF
jgi:protein involved in polysaccharide export with SLBB domain